LPVIINLKEDKNTTTVVNTTSSKSESENLGLDPCWNIHPSICKDYPNHPLIKERSLFYIE